MTPERLAELQAAQSKDEPLSVGVDVARFGDDKTVITRRRGSIVTNQHAYSKEDTEQTAGRVKMIYPAPEFIGIDEDGLGGGVVDKLTHDKIDGVVGILNNSSARKDDTGLTFVNLRSQLWWNLAERFKSGKIYIPPEFTELAAELSAIRYDITRQGIAVETKEQLKKRLHRSPDRADSLMYAFANFVQQAEVQRIAVARRRQK